MQSQLAKRDFSPSSVTPRIRKARDYELSSAAAAIFPRPVCSGDETLVRRPPHLKHFSVLRELPVS